MSLYRPGPMDLIPDYIRRKKGLTKIKYEHPLLKQVCADTYGIMIYQEQVQRAANVLAGYTLGQADLLRRAMGKKDKEKMAKERVNFIKGCAEVNGIDEKKANAIFDLLEKFAGYGFNKSHAAAYALITWRTAFLKANYPVEFMAALLSNAVNDTDKIAIFVAECQRMRIPICPPDVNQQPAQIRAGKHGRRRPGWIATIADAGAVTAHVRGLLPASVSGWRRSRTWARGRWPPPSRSATSKGPFASLEDFCARLDSRAVNKKILESLVRCGAFDFTGRDRAEMFAQIDTVMASAASAHRDRASGQASMFDDFAAPRRDARGGQRARGRRWTPWTKAEKLASEKELLGFYVTGPPAQSVPHILEQRKYTPIIATRHAGGPRELSTPPDR